MSIITSCRYDDGHTFRNAGAAKNHVIRIFHLRDRRFLTMPLLYFKIYAEITDEAESADIISMNVVFVWLMKVVFHFESSLMELLTM